MPYDRDGSEMIPTYDVFKGYVVRNNITGRFVAKGLPFAPDSHDPGEAEVFSSSEAARQIIALYPMTLGSPDRWHVARLYNVPRIDRI